MNHHTHPVAELLGSRRKLNRRKAGWICHVRQERVRGDSCLSAKSNTLDDDSLPGGAIPAVSPRMNPIEPIAIPAPPVSPELPSTTWRILLGLLRRLPQGAMSRVFGATADLPLPRPLRPAVLGSFARAVGADLAEAEHPLDEYPSLNSFFVRRLRSGARRWPENVLAMGSPVDGVVGQVGDITDGRILQAKGRDYSAAELLDDPAEAERFEGGVFATLYLSPRHYHRIHAPVRGRIAKARHVPGALLPVNGPAVAHIDDLFARNERLVCYLDGPVGRVAIVAIGAYNVGRISAAFDPRWGHPRRERSSVTNRSNARAQTREYEPPVRVRQGKEVMAFHLGSTVVLLVEPGAATLTPELRPGLEVRLGETIAQATTSSLK